MAERTVLSTLVERMTVGALARHAGVSVEELVERALAAPRPVTSTRTPSRRPAPPPTKRARPPKATAAEPRRRPAKTTKPRAKATSQPAAARSARAVKVREPTRMEIRNAVNRWLIGEALDQANGNISHAAERLGGARARIRKRWAAARTLPRNAMVTRLAKIRSSTAPPSPDELRALGTFRAVYEAVDRWLLTNALEQESGNVTKVAERLGTSRRLIRTLRERFGLGE